MSFKLVGDQFSQINATQKRRRSDLLLENVPDDEAILMKNGRYACVVCSRRPTFDTIEMLTVHRRGQKHASATVHRAEEQASFQLEVVKRRQNEMLAFDKGASSASTSASQPPLISATQESVRRALSKWSSPYDPRSGRHKTDDAANPDPTTSTGQPVAAETAAASSSSCGAADQDGGSSSQKQQHCDAPTYVFPARAGQTKKRKTTDAKGVMPTSAKNSDAVETKKAERIKHLLESGWVLCNDGTWVKDPGAEFDSDEEPPSPL